MVSRSASRGVTPWRTGDWSRTLSVNIGGAYTRRLGIGTAVATTASSPPVGGPPMLRAEVTQKILSQKRLKRLSWKTIVAEIGGGAPVYITAALMGQMKLRPDQ